METTAWADVYGLEADSAEDVKGWESAFERAETLIKNEMNNGIPSNRIVLGGFSMGGAVALHTALRSKYQLGGVIALSTWLPLMDRFPGAIGERCPILMAHGTDDNIVKYSLGLRTNALLDSMNRDVSFVAVQGMGHTVSNGVVEECKKFIEGAVSRASASG